MKTLKTLFIALAIPALLLAVAGCKEPGADTKYPPSNITVTKADGSALTDPLSLSIDEELELRVSATEASSYDWDVADNNTVELLEGGGSATAKFKGLAAGSTNIVAYARNSDGFIYKEVPVTVIERKLSMTLTIMDGTGAVASPLTIDIGENKILTAVVTGEDDAEIEDAEITWTSNHPETVEVEDDTNGKKIAAIAEGTATITVTAEKSGYENASSTFTVNVRDPNLPNLTLTVKKPGGEAVTADEEISMEMGSKITFTIEVEDEDGAAVTDPDVEWLSNPPETVTFSNNEVTAADEGTADITVTVSKSGFNSTSLAFRIIVTPKRVLVLDLSSSAGTWNSEHDELTVDHNVANLTLTVTGTVDAANVTLTSTAWEVTGAAGVVTINEATGAVTVLKPGTTEIKVTAEAAEAEDEAEKTITLVVRRVYDADVIFEWHLDEVEFSEIATGTQPGSLPNGSPGVSDDPCIPTSAADRFVKHPDFPGISLRTYGTPLFYNEYTGEKGFRLGGYNNQGAPRFVIGQGNHYATAAGDAVTAVAGEIDLSQRKVKVTVGYADIVDDGVDRYHLRIYVNNNGTSQANSSLGDASSIATFIWESTNPGANPPIQISTADANSTSVKAGSTKESGELYAIIDPTTFESNPNKAALRNAAITLHAQHSNDSGITNFAEGNWITITYIKIEYTGGVVVAEPVDLTIKDGETEVGASILMDLSDAAPKTLTATTDPADAEVTWEITSGSSVSLSATSGATSTITATETGVTTIKVTATKEGYSATSKTFNVTVTDSSGPPPASDLIFEWSHAANGAPDGMTWSTGANAAATVSTAKLTGTGTGKYTEVPISLASGANNTESITYNNGISFAADAANARILVIGAGIGKSVTTAGPTHQAGMFDFLNNFPEGKTRIQVTLTIASFTGGAGNFSVTLNNNTTAAASCPLTPTQGGGARIIFHQTPNSTPVTTPGNNGTWDGSTTYVSRAFNASDFTAGAETLGTAFIGLAHTAAAAGSNAFTITGIKIEYID